MMLCWLQMFFFVCAPTPTYPRGPVWLPDHLDGNPCEDMLRDQWRSLNLDHTKDGLEHQCKCHADKCIYIAALHTLRKVPVYWAYQVRHGESTVLFGQDFLKNIWTWYIPPKIIGSILRGKGFASQRIILRSSLPMTHIASGLVPAKKKHIISQSNGLRKNCIDWIAYNHTGFGGVTFHGAAIREGYQWKRLPVIQLANLLARTYSSAKVFKRLSGHQKASKLGLEIFPKEPAFTYYKKLAVGTMLNGHKDTSLTSTEDAFEMYDRKKQQSGLGSVEEEDTFQIEGDSLEGSEISSEADVELTGEVLGISQDFPEESWLDHRKHPSRRDIFYRRYDVDVSMTDSENGIEQNRQILGIMREGRSSLKMRPQQTIVPSSLGVVPDKKTKEVTPVFQQPEHNEDTDNATLQIPEDLTTPEAPFTENLSVYTEAEAPQKPETTLTKIASRPHYTEDIEITTGIEINGVGDHGETTRKPWLKPATEVLDTKSSTEVTEREYTIKQVTPTAEDERSTQWSATTSLVEATGRVQLRTASTQETTTPTWKDPQSTSNKSLQVSEAPQTSVTVGLKTECTGKTTMSATAVNKDESSTKTEDHSESTLLKTAEVLKDECPVEPVPMVPLTPELSQRFDAVITTTSAPEVQFTKTQAPPNNRTGSEDNTKPRVSPEPRKTTDVPKQESTPTFTREGLEAESAEETTIPATTSRTDDHSDITVAPKREDQSTTTVPRDTTKTVKVLDETVPTLSLTPETISQRSDVTITATSVPEVASARSLDAERTEETRTQPDTTYNTASPEPVKTTQVLEAKCAKETSVPDVTRKGLKTESTEENGSTMETSSEDPSKWLCYGLIHHTPTALRRCVEKMIALLKMQETTPRSHLPPTAHSSKQSDLRSQKGFQRTQSDGAVNHINDISRKTLKLKDEDNDHFYFFDGKLRIRDNHAGPRVTVK